MEPDSEDCVGQVTWDRVLQCYTCDTHRVLEPGAAAEAARLAREGF